MSRRSGRTPTYRRTETRRQRAQAEDRTRTRSRGERKPPNTKPSRKASPRRRRRSGRALIAALVSATALLAAGGWGVSWLLDRPVALYVTATPDDALVRLIEAPAAEGTGSLEIGDLPPGEYTVEVTRDGFAPRTVEVHAERFRGASVDVTLDALPQMLELTSHPEGASCRIMRDGREVLAGSTPLDGEVLAGPLTIELSLPGHNTLTRELYLDHPTDLELWLDPEGQIVHLLGIAEASGAPKGVAITPDGTEVWTTILDGPPSIEIFDVATRTAKDGIDLDTHGAVEVVFSPDGSYAYASQMETARVFEIDTAAREVVRTFETGSAWSKVVELAPDGSRAYVANWSGNDVSEIDLASGDLVRRIPVARTPRGLWATPDGEALYVAGFGNGDLQRIDLETGDVTDLLSTGGAMRHLAGNVEGGVMFSSDMARDLIYRHDLTTGETAEFSVTDEKPNTIALSPDGRILFVSCRGANNPVSYYLPGPEWGTILLFDAVTGEGLDAIVGGNQCTALDVSNDGTLLVFSDFLDSQLRFYEIPPYETLSAGDGGRFGDHRADVRK